MDSREDTVAHVIYSVRSVFIYFPLRQGTILVFARGAWCRQPICRRVDELHYAAIILHIRALS